MKESLSPEVLRNRFWEKDKNQGGIIKRQYEEIKDVLFNKNFSWVDEQYNKIKEHAIRETDFYRNFRITDKFPITNKRILSENMEAFRARGGYQIPIHITHTSGSTGTPFTVFQDYCKRKRTIADLKVFGELCDYPSHERMIFFRIINETLHRTPEQEAEENIYYIDSSLLDEKHLEKMVDIVLEKKPRIIFSYSSTLVELTKYIEKLNIPSNSFSMKSVLCAGEALAEEDRKLMEKVYGCKVYRRYSDMEMGILGQDLGDGGSYLLNYGSYYFECLELDSDMPAKDGEVGRIVVTDLFNYAFPMIRYDTGDLGIMQHRKGEFPQLSQIFGRARDCVYTPEGLLLAPAKISTSMWGIKGLKQWQFIQRTKNEYIIRLNGSGDLDPKIVLEKMYKILGNNAKVTVDFASEIPVLASNKRRAIINEYR